MKNNEDIRQAFLRKMKYPVALEFSEENHRNPSKYRIEEHDMLNWVKQQRKLLNAAKNQ